jgi:hypothetical protein
MNRAPAPAPRRQRGIALPVMLLMLAVLLVSSTYLLKASLSSTLMSNNLAYDASLSRAADLGLLTGFQWLKDTAAANKGALDANDAENAYVANFNTAQTTASAGFWAGSVLIDDRANSGFQVEYVIHRMCALAGTYDRAANSCMQTAPNTAVVNNTVALGDSLASDSVSLAGAPQVHYIVTARIFGSRGGNVVNQAVVMIGA